MTFAEMLKFRRSVRNYQDTPVSMDIIESLLLESTFAPSAGNGQPWKFIVVNNKETLANISSESKKNLLTKIATNPNSYTKKYEKILQNESYNIFYNAPTLILIIGNAKAKNLHVECALAACYLMMAAASRGLGSCWVNLGTEIKNPEMLRRLGIPEEHQIVAPIILGYPDRIPSVPSRKYPEIINIIE